LPVRLGVDAGVISVMMIDKSCAGWRRVLAG
jgi:hypothetical protein